MRILLVLIFIIFSSTVNASEIYCDYYLSKIKVKGVSFQYGKDIKLFNASYSKIDNRIARITNFGSGDPKSYIEKFNKQEQEIRRNIFYKKKLGTDEKSMLQLWIKEIDYQGSIESLHNEVLSLKESEKKELMSKIDNNTLEVIYDSLDKSYANNVTAHPMAVTFNKWLYKERKKIILNNKRIIAKTYDNGMPIIITINDNYKESILKDAVNYELTDVSSDSIFQFRSACNEIDYSNKKLDIKNKLKTLKELLDSGLISKQQYEDKSSKILDNF